MCMFMWLCVIFSCFKKNIDWRVYQTHYIIKEERKSRTILTLIAGEGTELAVKNFFLLCDMQCWRELLPYLRRYSGKKIRLLFNPSFKCGIENKKINLISIEPFFPCYWMSRKCANFCPENGTPVRPLEVNNMIFFVILSTAAICATTLLVSYVRHLNIIAVKMNSHSDPASNCKRLCCDFQCFRTLEERYAALEKDYWQQPQ